MFLFYVFFILFPVLCKKPGVAALVVLASCFSFYVLFIVFRVLCKSLGLLLWLYVRGLL